MNLMREIVLKYKNLSVQVKASVWFVACSILQRGISFFTVPIFTRIMSPEQYGQYNAYVAWYSILLVFTSMSLYYGVFNNALIKFKEDKKRYVSSMQGLVCVLTSSFFLIYLLIRPLANKILQMTTPMVLMLFAELMVTPALHFWSAYNRFEYKYRSIVAVTLLMSIANPVIGILLVVISEDKAIARIFSAVIVEVIFCGMIIIYQFGKGKAFFVKDYWKYAFMFNLPLLPHYLSGQILNQSDRIMISRMVGNVEVALYSVAYSIGLLMNIFVQAINGSYTPWFYQKFEKKEYGGICEVINMIALMMAIFVIALILFAPEAIFIVGGVKYKEAVYVIPPVAASVFFIFMYNVFANVEFYYEKKHYVMYGSIISAVCNLILNYIFIKRFGYVAAAYTTFACYIVYCFIHFYFAVKICRENKMQSSIFDFKWIFYLSGSVIVIGIIMNLIYRMAIVRYIITGVAIVLVVIFRDYLLNSLKRMSKLKK